MTREVLSPFAYDELTGRIKSPSALDAFHLVTDRMGKMGGFEFRPNIKGDKKALHFRSGNVSYFSFIANNNWLFWYFRKPGFQQSIFTWKQLEASFPKLARSKRADVESQEGTLRIVDGPEAEDLMIFVSQLKL